MVAGTFPSGFLFFIFLRLQWLSLLLHGLQSRISLFKLKNKPLKTDNLGQRSPHESLKWPIGLLRGFCLKIPLAWVITGPQRFFSFCPNNPPPHPPRLQVCNCPETFDSAPFNHRVYFDSWCLFGRYNAGVRDVQEANNPWRHQTERLLQRIRYVCVMNAARIFLQCVCMCVCLYSITSQTLVFSPRSDSIHQRSPTLFQL